MVYATLAIRWILGLVLARAAISKVVRRDTAEVIARYRIIPAALVPVAAGTIPSLELLIAAALLLGVWPAFAGVACALLILIFAAVISVNLVRGEHFDCGCGAGDDVPIGWSLVLRNVLLALLAGVLAVAGSRGLAVSPDGNVIGSTPRAADLIVVPMLVVLVSTTGQVVSALYSGEGRSMLRRRSKRAVVATHAAGRDGTEKLEVVLHGVSD